MTLRQLRYAVMVYRCGSLSSAARALFVSQSALSFAIKELEQEMQITIFERSRHGMRPTKEGLAFLRKAHSALKTIDELSERSGIGAVKMRIATVQSGVLPTAFSNLVNELGREEKGYRIRCVMCENYQVIKLLETGECDMGFIYATERQAKVWRNSFVQRGMEIIEIRSVPNLVIISADDPLASRAELSFDDLSEHAFVFSGEDGLDDYSYLADYSAIDFRFHEHRRYLNVQDSLLLNHLLHTTKSFSLGHRSFIEPYSTGIAYVPLRDCQTIYFWLLRTKGKPMTNNEARFVELMREACAKL